MRLLWDPTRELDPKTMEDLVLLEQAGVRCVGSKRDEELVDQVAAMLEKNPQVPSVRAWRHVPSSSIFAPRCEGELGACCFWPLCRGRWGHGP